MDKKLLRVIIIDDSPDDADLVADALRRAGYMLKTQRAHDLASLRATLGKGAWDAVISECDVPDLGISTTLDQLQRSGLDLPFVIMTGALNDADFVKFMQEGAHDIVLKSQGGRLAPVLERELAAAEMRRQKTEATETLRRLEEKHSTLIAGSQEAVG